MDINVVEIIVGVLGGGTLATIFQTWRESKKDKSEEIFNVLDTYKAMIADLRDVEGQCKKTLETHQVKINELQETINDLRQKLILLESASSDLPFPMWLKDVHSKILWLNYEYEKEFLLPNNLRMSDYIGKFDSDIWPKEIADEFIRNDKEVLKLKGIAKVVDDEHIILDGVDMSRKWRVVKYLRYAGSTVIGIGGIAIPVE